MSNTPQTSAAVIPGVSNVISTNPTGAATGNLTNTTDTAPTGTATQSSSGFKLSSGWWLFIAIGVTVLFSDTQFGILFVGVLTVGLIYQLSQAAQGH